MSIDNRDEINRLKSLQKQQDQIRHNNDILNLQPLVKQKNHTEQGQIVNYEQENANVLQSGNNANKQWMQLNGYQPKGSRPQSKISPLKNGHIFFTQNNSKMENYNDLIINNNQNPSHINVKTNSQTTHKKQQFKIKPNLNILKIVKDAFHTHQNANKKLQSRSCDEQDIQSNERQNLYINQQQNQKQPGFIQMNNQSYNFDYQDEQNKYSIKNDQFRSRSTQKGYSQKYSEGNHQKHAIYEKIIIDYMMNDYLHNQKIKNEQQNNENSVNKEKKYGIEDINIKGGGGGMIKKKRKYDYKFRDVDELAEESKRSPPYGLVEMRLTPKLYDKRQKLQTINEWKNQRMISCEEDMMQKQDLSLAEKLKKKRLEDQLNVINKQQIEWEYIASHQLQKNLIKNADVKQNNKYHAEQELKIFQDDIDKRIHNLYIDEKIKKFSAEQQNTEDSTILHTQSMQKEKERLQEQENQVSKEKMKKKQFNLKNFHSSQTESPERINNFETLQLEKNQQNFIYPFQHEQKIPLSQINTRYAKNSLNKIKNESQEYMKDFAMLKYNTNEELTNENSFVNYLVNQSVNTINKSDYNPLNDQVSSLYSYYQNLQQKKDSINQTNQSKILSITGDDNENQSLETCIQQNKTNQDKIKLPYIENTPLKRQPNPFTLSEQKPVQNEQLSSLNGLKKLSIDSHLQRSQQQRSFTRNESPLTNYNVQIDYHDKRQRNYSSNANNQTRSLLGRKKGFLNQSFIRY